jgi:hypothetical protein
LRSLGFAVIIPRREEIPGEQVQGSKQLGGVWATTNIRSGFGESEGVAHSTIRDGGPGGGESVIPLRFDGEAQPQVGPATAADRAGVVGGPADGAGQRHRVVTE